MTVLAPIVIDDLDEYAGRVVADLADAHELEPDERVCVAMTNAFLAGVKLGAAEIAAALIGQGIDVQLDLSGVRLAEHG